MLAETGAGTTCKYRHIRCTHVNAEHTIEVNALQVLVDSHKFDLSEPLLFHLPYSRRAIWSLSVEAVDLIWVAMLIDCDSDIDDPNSYPLLKTLIRKERSSRLDTNPHNGHAPMGGDRVFILVRPILRKVKWLIKSIIYCMYSSKTFENFEKFIKNLHKNLKYSLKFSIIKYNKI